MDVSKLSLNTQKVLGSSVTKINHITHAKGCLLYTASNLIIFYSPILDEQISYISHTSDNISAITVSPDEKYLAVCDMNKYGTVAVYDIDDLESVKGRLEVKWILRGHKKCIDHVVFSSNGKYLVTVSNQDGSMFVWEGAETVTKNRNSKAISKVLFDGKGDLVTIGRGYIKLWPFKQGNIIKKVQNDQQIMEGKSLSFGKKFNTQDFVDAALLVRDNTERLVLLSSQGLICIISPGYEKAQKWIDVMMQGAVSLQLVDSVALCCGDHALVKAVDIEKLVFKGKFPKPPPTARENLTEEEPLECMQNDQFPKCLGVRRVDEFVVTLYSNRSMFVWKMEQDGDIQAVRSILSPRAKVTCLKILQEVEGGELIFFATSSDDHTVRLWHCYGKETALPRRSVDVGALLGLKRNVYCKHLTHIIYTHSEHPVTQIKAYCKSSIVCLARNQLLIYSLENFGLSLLENFDDDKVTCLQTWKQLILLAMGHNKIRMFEYRDEKLEKIRQLTVESAIERIFVSNDRLVVNGKGIARVLSLEGNQLFTYYKSEKIGVAGNYLLSCEKKVLNVHSLVRNKRTATVTLSHEVDQNEYIKAVKSNSWLIVLITNNNRLLLLNFSATVLYSQQIYSTITDVQITEQGKIMLSTQNGVIFIRNQSTTAKYKQIDQKVQKWFEQNDMNWMDGSVWASKHRIDRSHSLSGKSQDLLKGKSIEEQKKEEKEKLPELKIEDSIKLGGGSWADLSVSLKKPDVFQEKILQYNNQHNKRSIFNPSSICAQVNKIYKDVDALQNKKIDQKKPPLATTNKSGSLLSGLPSFIDDRNDISLQASKSRKKIFNSNKDKDEQYFPKFSNNLVQSIIDPTPKYKMPTQITGDPQSSRQRQQQSIDFNLSQYESKPTQQQHDICKTKQLPLKPELIQSMALLLQLPQEMQTHENLVSIILQHSQEYQILYKILDKVYGKEQRSTRRENLLKKMEGLWEEMKDTVERQI